MTRKLLENVSSSFSEEEVKWGAVFRKQAVIVICNFPQIESSRRTGRGGQNLVIPLSSREIILLLSRSWEKWKMLNRFIAVLVGVEKTPKEIRELRSARSAISKSNFFPLPPLLPFAVVIFNQKSVTELVLSSIHVSALKNNEMSFFQ